MSYKITIWNEFRHERHDNRVQSVYPQGIHAAIAQALDDHDVHISQMIAKFLSSFSI